MIIDANTYLPRFSKKAATEVLSAVPEKDIDPLTYYLCQINCEHEINPCTVEDACGLCAHLDSLGITKAVVSSPDACYCREEEDLRRGAIEVEEAVSAYPERLIPSFSVHPSYYEESLRQIETATRYPGHALIGPLFFGIQGFSLTDDATVDIVTQAAEADLPVRLHIFFDEEIDEVVTLAGAVPRGKFLISSLGWGSRYSELEKTENIWVDTAEFPFCSAGTYAKALKHLGPDRIIFGTGFPAWEGSIILKIIHELNIPDSEKEDILYKNFLHLFDRKQND